MNPIQLNMPGGAPYTESTMYMAPVTTLNRGMWRINYSNIVRLIVGDKFMCVIPAENNNHIKIADRTRVLTLDLFKRSLLADRSWLSPSEK